MKNLVFIIFIFTLFACKKKSKDLIIGKWDQRFEANDPLMFDANWEYWQLVFYHDGTGTLQTYRKNEELDSPKEFTYKLIHDGKAIEVVFNQRNSKLHPNQQEQWTINRLDNDKLMLQLMPEVILSFKKLR